MATRRPLPPLQLPPYELEEVPLADRELSGSVVIKLIKREKWLSHLSAMLLLCNEAANRRIRKLGQENGESSDATQSKPLGLEYIADRLDTDDPLWGYQVRTLNEGWLQGFITITTFTVWQRNFRWDSLAPENGVMQYDMQGRVWDKKGALARDLEAQPRDGDPDGEGIIWPTVAELSLLGGLGCGRTMVKLVLEELEAGGQYDYIVLQATDNAITFYESMGFTRVGAVARYRDEQRRPNLEAEPQEQQEGQVAGGARFGRKLKRGREEGGLSSSSSSIASTKASARPQLPEWLRNKKFRFVVGSQGASANAFSSTDGDFFVYVENEWESEQKYRLFQRVIMHDKSHRVREWQCVEESGHFAHGSKRFIALDWRTEVLPTAATLQVSVRFGRTQVALKDCEVAEVIDETKVIAEAYTKLQGNIMAGMHMQAMSPSVSKDAYESIAEMETELFGAASSAAEAPLKTNTANSHTKNAESKPQPAISNGPVVDWKDHSPKNVAKRQEAGFVAYCHWTFPEQSVDDIYPSYMMARRLVRRPPPLNGAMSLVRTKLMNNLPPVKQTREVLDQHRAAEDDEDAATRPDLFNKVVRVANREDFYYVLHYVKDMYWCRIVPMQRSGVFTGSTVRAGRPRYKLTPEGHGKELDLPGSYCKIVTAFTVSKTTDADKETWDLVSDEEAEEYTRLLAEERRKGKKSEIAASPGKVSKEPPLWMQACERTLRKLMRHRNAWPFKEPVDPVALNLPDYFRIVQQPMDLTTVRSKLESFGYKRAEDWVEDVRLCFDNAMLYNPSSDKVHQLAIVMSDCLERDWFKEEAKLDSKGVRVCAGTPKPRPGQDAPPDFLQQQDSQSICSPSEVLAEQGCWPSEEDDGEGASASSTVEFFEGGFPRSPVLR